MRKSRKRRFPVRTVENIGAGSGGALYLEDVATAGIVQSSFVGTRASSLSARAEASGHAGSYKEGRGGAIVCKVAVGRGLIQTPLSVLCMGSHEWNVLSGV